ncbi:MAG: spore coat protein CotH, partial [Bacteroidetes bacterium]|nr:spore coat protein CotH [Bacteroidota bacterium]
MAQSFSSSDLPIVVIKTNGQTIVNEPKITADMGIIDNGAGVRNNLADPFNVYNGKIGIEKRGSSSQMFLK